MKHAYFATAPFSLEGVVAEELRQLGFEGVRAQNAGVAFDGTLPDALRANLWLRCADRVLLRVGSFPARTFDELFEGVKALPWPDLLPKGAAFPVSGKCARSQLMSLPDVQAITKKAIAEKMGQAYHLSWMPEDGAKYAIDVHLHGDVATLSIDTSGPGLSRRGYRTYNGEAPLRETMAAALLKLSFWRPGQPLCDPMCGTGTIAIEAAMMALDRAPGLGRAFDMERWEGVDQKAIALLHEEATERARMQEVPPIFANDIDPKAISLTKKHVEQAGLAGKVRLSTRPFLELRDLPKQGAFVTNPPYGERLMDKKSAEALYRDLGQYAKEFPGWSLTAITAHHGFERLYGKKAVKTRRMFNGRIECNAYLYPAVETR